MKNAVLQQNNLQLECIEASGNLLLSVMLSLARHDCYFGVLTTVFQCRLHT